MDLRCSLPSVCVLKLQQPFKCSHVSTIVLSHPRYRFWSNWSAFPPHIDWFPVGLMSDTLRYTSALGWWPHTPLSTQTVWILHTTRVQAPSFSTRRPSWARWLHFLYAFSPIHFRNSAIIDLQITDSSHTKEFLIAWFSDTWWTTIFSLSDIFAPASHTDAAYPFSWDPEWLCDYGYPTLYSPSHLLVYYGFLFTCTSRWSPT